MWKCALLKKERKSKAKKLSVDFLWNCRKVRIKFCLRHNSMTGNVIHYLNIKILDILVEIIDLQLCSSLK